MSEPTFLGSNINLVKIHNQQAILLSLLHEKRLSRVQLAQKTSLSTTTITNLVSELLENGIVVEEGSQTRQHTEQRSVQRSVGRPRTALRLVPDARYAVGVHIGIGLFRVAIVNLCADLIENTIRYYSLDTSPEEVLGYIVNTVKELIDLSGVECKRIIGIGVGASGLVDYQNGVNLLAPNLGWRNVPIQEYLEGKLTLPVVVDNNVRAMALGEAFFGLGRGIETLAFVYGRTGVGAGFVFGGQVYRGSSTGAGEIGHIKMLLEGGELCRCGKRGCLETLVSEPVIVHQAQNLARRQPDSLLARLLAQTGDSISEKPIEHIFTAARQGDPATKEMIEEKAYYLGIALANLVNILNPELILLGGMFAQGQDLILPTATRTMQEMAFAGLGEKVRLQTTGFGWRAGVIGASSLALTRFFYQQTLSPQGAPSMKF